MGPYEYLLKGMRRQQIKQDPRATFDAEFWVRRTGRSTGQALFLLGCAMREPGEKFHIKNHSTGGKLATREMNVIMYSLLRDLIQRLELEFFTLDKHELTIVYNPPGRENL